MYRKIAILVLTGLFLLVNVNVVQADKPVDNDKKGTGFDSSGYNDNAHIFNGTYGQWCIEKIKDESYCRAVYGTWWDDKLIMKWNAEWDRGNLEGWKDSYYNARLSNISNGRLPGGSGEKSVYKMVWVGPCGEDGNPVPTGGYCIWGQFAVIMDKAQINGKVVWNTRAIPAGYGHYFQKPE